DRSCSTAAAAHGTSRAAMGESAGKIEAAMANPNTARAAFGSAFRPKAGTSVTVGNARAHARPRAARSMPCAVRDFVTSSRIEAVAVGTPRQYHYKDGHGVRSRTRRQAHETARDEVRLEGRRALRARRRREERRARLSLREPRTEGASDVRRGARVSA